MLLHTQKIPCDVSVTLIYPPCMARIQDISKATWWKRLESRKSKTAEELLINMNVDRVTNKKKERKKITKHLCIHSYLHNCNLSHLLGQH